MDSPKVVLCALEAAETVQSHSRLSAGARRAGVACLATGGVWQRLVATGWQPSGCRSHEPGVVEEPGPHRSDRKVRPVESVQETAGYDEYVRWCGRTGAVRPPPTRLCDGTGQSTIGEPAVTTVRFVRCSGPRPPGQLCPHLPRPSHSSGPA